MESIQTQPQPTTPVEKTNQPGNERLIALCDGIFAVAITLLVFDLKLPSLPDNTPYA